jgi:copper(I)-binding protein
MHRTIIENDQARMVKQDSMTVNAGELLKFEPGGSHLMLFNPKKPLQSGDEIDLTLILENDMKLNIKAHVRKHSEMQSMEHPH